MVRGLLFVGMLLISCKKESSSGLPPAQDWQGGAPGPAGSGARAAPGMLPGENPHAGVDMGGAGSNPHAGLDLGGGSGNPHAGVDMGGGGMMPGKTAPHTLDKLADGRLGLGPFSLVAPKEWTERPTTSDMRAAHFVLSTTPKEDAELIVYYFGASGAGSVQDNLDRWLDQFQQPDGKPSKDVAKIEKAKFADQDATVVSVSGRYTAMAMPGATDAVDKTDQSLLAAIIDSPNGPYYFKLVGAKKTVDAHAARFRAMLGSLKRR